MVSIYPILRYAPALLILWIFGIAFLIRPAKGEPNAIKTVERRSSLIVAILWLVVGGFIAYFISTLPNFDTTGEVETSIFLVTGGIVLAVFGLLVYRASKKV